MSRGPTPATCAFAPLGFARGSVVFVTNLCSNPYIPNPLGFGLLLFYADSTPTKSRGAAFSTLTSCTIGALQQEQQLRVQLGLARQRRELGDLGRA